MSQKLFEVSCSDDSVYRVTCDHSLVKEKGNAFASGKILEIYRRMSRIDRSARDEKIQMLGQIITEFCSIEIDPVAKFVDIIVHDFPLVSPTGPYCGPSDLPSPDQSIPNLLSEILNSLCINGASIRSMANAGVKGWRISIEDRESISALFDAGFFSGVPAYIIAQMRKDMAS
jgi:hypothetical protein